MNVNGDDTALDGPRREGNRPVPARGAPRVAVPARARKWCIRSDCNAVEERPICSRQLLICWAKDTGR